MRKKIKVTILIGILIVNTFCNTSSKEVKAISKIGTIRTTQQVSSVSSIYNDWGFSGDTYTDIFTRITNEVLGLAIDPKSTSAATTYIAPRSTVDWWFVDYLESTQSVLPWSVNTIDTLYTSINVNKLQKSITTYDKLVFLGLAREYEQYMKPCVFTVNYNTGMSSWCGVNRSYSYWYRLIRAMQTVEENTDIASDDAFKIWTQHDKTNGFFTGLEHVCNYNEVSNYIINYIADNAKLMYENNFDYPVTTDTLTDWYAICTGVPEPTNAELNSFIFDLFTYPAYVYSYNVEGTIWNKLLKSLGEDKAEMLNSISAISTNYFSHTECTGESAFGNAGIWESDFLSTLSDSTSLGVRTMNDMYNLLFNSSNPALTGNTLDLSTNYSALQRYMIYSVLGVNHTNKDIADSEEAFIAENLTKVCADMLDENNILKPTADGIYSYKNWFVYIMYLTDGVDLTKKRYTLNVIDAEDTELFNRIKDILQGKYAAKLKEYKILTDEDINKLTKEIAKRASQTKLVSTDAWNDFDVYKIIYPESYGISTGGINPNMTAAQRATLLSLLYTNSSKVAESGIILPSVSTCVQAITDAYGVYENASEFSAYAPEFIEQGLAEFNSVMSSTNTTVYTREMLTFDSRVKYLLGYLGQYEGITIDSDDNPTIYDMDPSIIDYYNEYMGNESDVIKLVRNNALLMVQENNKIDYSSIAYPKGISFCPYNSILCPIGVDIGDEAAMNAYACLMDTAIELKAYQTILVKELQNLMDASNLPSTATQYTYALKSIYNGLVLLNSDELWDMWYNIPDASLFAGLKVESLSTLYNNALAADLFNTDMEYAEVINDTNPLSCFFDPNTKTLSANLAKGIAYSASYIPMSTNVYDPYTLVQYDDDFLKNFHYKYGFNRKALYRSKSTQAAMNYYTTGSKGDVCVCTLKDLLKCEDDLVLYIDDNLYNTRDLSSRLGMAYSRNNNAEDAKISLTETITNLFSIDIINIAKTAEKTSYSEDLHCTLYNNANEAYVSGMYKTLGNGTGVVTPCDNNGDYVLTSGYIDKYLSDKEYNVLKSYAVISAIYRYGPLYNLTLVTNPYNTPVFIASSKLATAASATGQLKNSIFNYILMRNLSASIQVDYTHNIDMNSPLYMDVYGNILTESGVVVIPAAANATLYTEDYRKNIYNLAFYTTYGNTYSLTREVLPADYSTLVDSVLTDVNGVYSLRDNTIGDANILLSNISNKDIDLKQTLQSIELQCLSAGMGDFQKMSMICLEVLRGAPIESIDKEEECLSTLSCVDISALESAAKLEKIVQQFDTSSENTNLSVGALVHIDGIEYILAFAVKTVIAAMVVVMLIVIYIDAVSYHLSGRTFWKCCTIIILTVLCITAVPCLFELTYYGSNRLLLQKETELISMLNQEKEVNGVEVGITEIQAPSAESDILLLLESVRIPYYDLFNKIMFGDTVSEVKDIVTKQIDKTGLAEYARAEIYRDGVYISTSNLFASSDIFYNDANKHVYQTVTEEIPASFYTPYYVFVDALLSDVNTYNELHDVFKYDVKYQEGGRFSTTGLICSYFQSPEFLDDNSVDVLSLYKIYNVQEQLLHDSIFTPEEINQMSKSGWYSDITDEDTLLKRIQLINKEARKFVTEHNDMLGSVTDETFIKALALHLAMYHNQIMGYAHCDSFEIYKLSNTDLLRVCTTDKYSVIINSALTYPRFVAETGGALSVYASAFLILVNWLESVVTPLLVVAIALLVFVSVFIFRVCLRKKSSNLTGYIAILLILCVLNIVRALGLKLLIYIAQTSFSPTVCIIITAIIKAIYMVLLVEVLETALTDWRNLGSEKFMQKAIAFTDRVLQRPFRFVNRRMGHYRGYGYRYAEPYTRNRDYNNWSYYDALRNRQNKRYRR